MSASKKKNPGIADDDRNLVLVDGDFSEADLDDRAWLLWERYKGAFLVAAIIAFVAGVGFIGWRSFNDSHRQSVGADYDLAETPELKMSFAEQNQGEPLAAVAALEAADDAYAKKDYKTAGDRYARAAIFADAAKPAAGLVSGRALIGSAVCSIRTADTAAGVKKTPRHRRRTGSPRRPARPVSLPARRKRLRRKGLRVREEAPRPPRPRDDRRPRLAPAGQSEVGTDPGFPGTARSLADPGSGEEITGVRFPMSDNDGSSAQAPAIEAVSLCKNYGAFKAVSEVSFTVRRGEIVGFLGPNGAGKSTTMRILSGLMPAASGTARLCGVSVPAQPDLAKRRLGYMPENNPLPEDLRVVEYLAWRARLKGVAPARVRERVEAVMEACDLARTARRKLIGTLSKGFKQRVGIADALLAEPEVVILDEPTIGLDPHQILGIRDLIRSLRGKMAVLISSHILAEIEQVCDRVIIINGGRIVAEGDKDALRREFFPGRVFSVICAAAPATVAEHLGASDAGVVVAESAAPDASGARMLRIELPETSPLADTLLERLVALPGAGLRKSRKSVRTSRTSSSPRPAGAATSSPPRSACSGFAAGKKGFEGPRFKGSTAARAKSAAFSPPPPSTTPLSLETSEPLPRR